MSEVRNTLPSSRGGVTATTPTKPASAQGAVAFQPRVQTWMMACFGAEISADVVERNHRFLEEALELVQSTGCTASEAHQLVDYVFGRDIGETHQEIGGVMVTLAALCLANGLDMHEAGEAELARVWTKVEKIRAKQAAKPKHSPLPQHVAAVPEPAASPAGGTSASVETVRLILEDIKASAGSHSVGRLRHRASQALAALASLPSSAPVGEACALVPPPETYGGSPNEPWTGKMPSPAVEDVRGALADLQERFNQLHTIKDIHAEKRHEAETTLEKAVAEERKACARVRPEKSETFHYQADGYASGWHAAISAFRAAIRARTLATPETESRDG